MRTVKGLLYGAGIVVIFLTTEVLALKIYIETLTLLYSLVIIVTGAVCVTALAIKALGIKLNTRRYDD